MDRVLSFLVVKSLPREIRNTENFKGQHLGKLDESSVLSVDDERSPACNAQSFYKLRTGFGSDMIEGRRGSK